MLGGVNESSRRAWREQSALFLSVQRLESVRPIRRLVDDRFGGHSILAVVFAEIATALAGSSRCG